jgi:hypothetical protein
VASSGSRPAAKAKAAAGGEGSQKIKLIVAAVVGVFALAVIGYQIFPGLFSGGSSTPAPVVDQTAPVQANSPDLAPGTTEPPIIPKARGAGKRAVSPG